MLSHDSPNRSSFYSSPLSTSPTSYSTPLWFPPPRRTSDMSVAGPNPYATMEIPNVDMVRQESKELYELQRRDIELAASGMVGAALDLHVREQDKAAVAKLKEAATAGGGSGPKT
ncbi:hypothetical protein JCM11491_004811 [Sporobolomyces phaffii]